MYGETGFGQKYMIRLSFRTIDLYYSFFTPGRRVIILDSRQMSFHHKILRINSLLAKYGSLLKYISCSLTQKYKLAALKSGKA